MYEFVLQRNYNAEKRASDVKKSLWRIVVNRIWKVRQTTCNWIKKILDEATWMANVFLISWFLYLFLSCSISLLVKYDFILRYEAWVNAIRASSFIENVPQISAKPIAFQRNLLGKLYEIGHSLPIIFQRNWSWKFPRNSRKISHFFREFAPENPAKFDFFSRDLPEALISWEAQVFKCCHTLQSGRICGGNCCKDLSAFVGSWLIGRLHVGSSLLWDSIRKCHDFVVFIDHHV